MQTAENSKSIRELIAELADLEDRARAVATVVEPSHPGGSRVNPELLELARRESQVITALRRCRSTHR
ncbi:hypothetical protein GCM10009721_20240 [Terrabacter tumescens]|uniref:Uncharacterized protein n=1 Tax=Terrabacter tumescens TaxID=60443 RepID=A0ABQ2HWT9_9MICO|nr:hypothetical protein [Terrabacter tumescens]GGM94023.1 hypothetical protein GCM10009721_20240 [Terrabacter tumescens]